MADIRSVKNQSSASPDVYVDQVRKQIGEDFTDKKMAGRKSKNELGKDDFIKLMSAQLKNQDPTNPMKNEEMAAQLAQFSALEQMVNVNTNLEKMAAGQRPQENVLAASLIGKKVLTDSSKFSMKNGEEPVIKYNLPENAAKTMVSVIDGKGEVVREYTMTGLKQGPQQVKWDGKNGKGQAVSAGEFSFAVKAIDQDEKPIRISMTTSGTVSGVIFEGGKPQLVVDGQKISLDVVNQIGDVGDGKEKAGAGAAAAKAPPAGSAPSPAEIKEALKSLSGFGGGEAKVDNKNSLQTKQPAVQKNDAPGKKPLANAQSGGRINNEANPSEVKNDVGRSEEDVASNMSGKMPLPLWNPSANDGSEADAN